MAGSGRTGKRHDGRCRTGWRRGSGRESAFAEQGRENRGPITLQHREDDSQAKAGGESEKEDSGDLNHELVLPASVCDTHVQWTVSLSSLSHVPVLFYMRRSEERRVGEEGVVTLRFRWSPGH